MPCTPAGIIQLLKRSNIDIDGKSCVVVGRSNIVGKPMSLLMLRENATVTVCHSHTKDLKDVCKNADILIVAIGKPKFIDASYVKDGAVVIDVESTEMLKISCVVMWILILLCLKRHISHLYRAV